ncbi:ribonuclease T2-like isoform X1 [Genypterus blacodes]|uniref:ribonuclease T2-like isoform X1 n=1 Tax=Genypterus blacodes TaxID=154954 RepID=UPI003F76AC66
MLCSSLPLLVFLGVAVYPVQPHQSSLGQEGKYVPPDFETHPKTPFCSWKCLRFTVQWPAAFCLSLDNSSQCRIPPDVHGWTIHGLWPLRAQKCCKCWPMFPSDVQDLEAKLNEQWPSLLKAKSNFQFWKDEWNKHGVCAGCVEGFNSPLQYFQICLKLRGRFDFHKALEDAGITPSCQQPYKLAQLRSILNPLLGDKHELQCITDDKES